MSKAGTPSLKQQRKQASNQVIDLEDRLAHLKWMRAKKAREYDAKVEETETRLSDAREKLRLLTDGAEPKPE